MESLYPYIYDIFVLAVLIICTVYGSYKGFLSMLTAFVGRIVAFALALVISVYAAGPIYDGFIAKSVKESVNENMRDIISENANASLTEIIEKSTEDMPSFIHKTALSYADKLTVDESDADKAAQAVESQIVAPIIISALKITIFIILLTIFLIMVKCLSKAFKIANDIPLIGGLNKVLGSLIGILNALIIVVVAAYIIRGAVLILGNDSKILNDETINKSVTFSYIYSVPTNYKGE